MTAVVHEVATDENELGAGSDFFNRIEAGGHAIGGAKGAAVHQVGIGEKYETEWLWTGGRRGSGLGEKGIKTCRGKGACAEELPEEMATRIGARWFVSRNRHV